MILYHGSNVAIEAIDFAKSKLGFVAEIERKGGETYQYYFGTRKALKYLKNL